MAEKRKAREILGPDEARGPYWYKTLKDGTIRNLENPPKGIHIIEYTEEVEFQFYWHYFTVMVPSEDEDHPVSFYLGEQCDFESHCGYDRGPGRNNIIRRMLNG
jgi:hypothetical protein